MLSATGGDTNFNPNYLSYGNKLKYLFLSPKPLFINSGSPGFQFDCNGWDWVSSFYPLNPIVYLAYLARTTLIDMLASSFFNICFYWFLKLSGSKLLKLFHSYSWLVLLIGLRLVLLLSFDHYNVLLRYTFWLIPSLVRSLAAHSLI